MNRYTSSLSVLLLPLVATPVRGADPKPRPADAAIEKVVADSLEAGRATNWRGYADLVHPDSLREYKDMWLPVLRAATRERPEKQADLLSAFDQATDLKTLMALRPKDFFVPSMKGMASQIPSLAANPPDADGKIIGTVHEGDDRAYVVVRTRLKGAHGEQTKVEVVSLKRSGAEWKLLLPDVVRIMAETFRRTRPDAQQSGPATDRADPDKKR